MADNRVTDNDIPKDRDRVDEIELTDEDERILDQIWFEGAKNKKEE